jgi:hypothetical protein
MSAVKTITVPASASAEKGAPKHKTLVSCWKTITAGPRTISDMFQHVSTNIATWRTIYTSTSLLAARPNVAVTNEYNIDYIDYIDYMWKNIWKKHMKKHIYIMSNSLSPKFLQFNTQLGPQWLVPAEIRSQKAYRNHQRPTNDTRWWGDAPCKACKVWEHQQFLTSQRKQISDDWIPHGLLCETLAEKCLKFWRDFWNPLFHPFYPAGSSELFLMV